MQTVVIENSTEAIINLPTVKIRASGETDKNGKKIGRVTGGAPMIPLVPGTNKLMADHWTVFSKHPGVQDLLKAGSIRVLEKDEGAVSQELQASLKSVSIEQALEEVQKCTDPKLLDAWADKEDRQPVLEAIIARDELLRGGPSRA